MATKKTRTKEEVTKDLEEVEDFTLADVEGIGNIRLKKLNLAGCLLYTSDAADE